MSAAALLTELQARGVRLSVVEGRLRVEAPKGILTPEDRQALVARKADLLAALFPWPGPCYCCGETAWWLHRDDGGQPICGRCHPPAFPFMVRAWLPAACCNWRGPCH